MVHTHDTDHLTAGAPRQPFARITVLNNPYTAPAAIVGVVFLTYFTSFRGAFQFSDYNVIVYNPAVHSWDGWFNTLRHAGIRPVLKFSYTLNWVSGLGLFGYHLFNISVHALCSLLVYFLARRFMESCAAMDHDERFYNPALLAALLFAVHPVQTEAITYISARSSSLMALFYLASLLAYVHGVETRRWQWNLLISPLCFILAVATKEVAVTLPFALLLWDVTVSKGSWKTMVRNQAVHWAILLAIMIIILNHQRYLELLLFSSQLRSAYENLLSQANGLAWLASRLVLVHKLNIDPDLPVVPRPDLAAMLGLIAVAGLTGFALWKRRGRPWLLFGLCWFFLVLVPSNSIVPRLDIVNERHLYLANFGLFLIIAMEAGRLGQALAPYRKTFLAGVGLVLVSLAIFTVIRNNDYRSEITLWESTVRNSPQKARAHYNLGAAYELGNLPDKAIAAYGSALRLDPEHEYAREGLDRVLSKRSGGNGAE